MSAPRSRYREIAPGAALSECFICLWAQSVGPGEGSYGQHVLPDGCIDIVWVGQAPPMVVGPFTHDFVAPLPAGSLLIGARFWPGSAPGFLGVPADALLNGEVPLRDLIGRASEELDGLFAEVGSAAARLRALRRWLERRAVRPGDRLVAEAFRRLAERPGVRIGALASRLEISERHLRRRCETAVGYGPKTLQRVLRLQRLLALARRPSGLADLALAAGYADQAHMTRETARLTGMSPARLLPGRGTTLGLADLFKMGPRDVT